MKRRRRASVGAPWRKLLDERTTRAAAHRLAVVALLVVSMPPPALWFASRMCPHPPGPLSLLHPGAMPGLESHDRSAL